MPNDRIGETLLRVGYKDTDRMGVVHHANFITYFEIARTEFMRGKYPYAQMERDGYFLPITEVGCSYHANVNYDDEVRMVTRVSRVTHVRIRFEYQAWRVRDNVLMVEGFTELACVNGMGRPTRLPKKLLDCVEITDSF
jgi:acyl-CoA thioester hydrolase